MSLQRCHERNHMRENVATQDLHVFLPDLAFVDIHEKSSLIQVSNTFLDGDVGRVYTACHILWSKIMTNMVTLVKICLVKCVSILIPDKIIIIVTI